VATTGDLLAYIRRAEGESFLIALNLGPAPCEFPLQSLGLRGRRVLSTYLDAHEEETTANLALRANEGVILELAPAAP
jgi:hypothetical protein